MFIFNTKTRDGTSLAFISSVSAKVAANVRIPYAASLLTYPKSLMTVLSLVFFYEIKAINTQLKGCLLYCFDW